MMKTIVKYKNFLAYSEQNNKYFYTEFGDGVNIIYGKNTSGKSTLIQAINYTFGINDEKHKLSELLNDNVIFRIDFEIQKTTNDELIDKYTFIRDDNYLFIYCNAIKLKEFRSVKDNNYIEHKQLKVFLADIFDYKLYLESSSEYQIGSIESIFLPYYVSQENGWMHILKSFKGFEYYKNFKYDYYDYYLGIINKYDRLKKQNLEKEKKNYEIEIKFLESFEKEKDELQLAKLIDETFIDKSANYIESFAKDKNDLIKNEKEYLLLINKIKLLEEKEKINKLVGKRLSNQNNVQYKCPVCNQVIPTNLELIYNNFQNIEDTQKQKTEIKEKISKSSAELKLLENRISELRKIISNNYNILNKYKINDLNVSKWIENKANIKLSNKIILDIDIVKEKLQEVKENLKEFKTDEEIREYRNIKDGKFQILFNDYLKKLNVNSFKHIYSLYDMPYFPQQGVELLKTMIAYYFAFNSIMNENNNIHRFPFVLDAIFKEDLDTENRNLIIDFVNKYKPNDTQIIFTVAESKDKTSTVEYYNDEIFNSKATLILISRDKERSFLKENDSKYDYLIKETLELMV